MRLRLFPLLMVLATAGVALKAGGIWHGLGTLAQAEPAVAGSRSPDFPSASRVQVAGRDPASGAQPNQDAKPAKRVAGEGPPATANLPSDPFQLTDEEIDLLQMLAERRTEIDRREAELNQRGTLLEAAERRIDEKISELESLQKTIEELLIWRDEQEETQLKSLVKIYESMKPKDAARIFEELDMAVLLDVIERMKERKTAPILARMNPRRAKAITIELAQRRSLPAARN
jgi:flagellar motility protein MotE (MotC chaperone)